MPFPEHDPAWCEAVDLLEQHRRPGESALAPDLFWWRLDDIHRFVRANLDPSRRYDWVVVHKGELAAIGPPFLASVVAHMTPVLANEVFVVWTARHDVPAVAPDSPHLQSFHADLAALVGTTTYVPLPAEADRVFGTEPRIRRFSKMTDAEMRAAQDEFFRGGGYTYPTARDRAYYRELRRHEARALARWAGRRVLDLACGATAAEPRAPGTCLVRTDLSPVGVAMARECEATTDGVHHAVVDAQRLAFGDRQFDAVMFVDAIEHVRDAALVFREMERVLRPGGEALVTFANRDSVNQVVARALGFADFVTNHQHMREFSTDEIFSMLDGSGFDVVETDGIELRPYWGVPGIDDETRDRLDEDEQFVELMVELGGLLGVEHAYVGVVYAAKR